MRRAVLFDLDGTLIDSAALHATAFSRAVGLWWGPCEVPVRTDLTTQQKMDLIGLPGVLRDDVQRTTRRMTLESIPKLVRPDERLNAELWDLRKDSLLGVVTNARREPAEAMLKAMDLWEIWDLLVTSEDGKHKPAPDLYRLARNWARQLDADQIVALEDSDAGIWASTGAGIPCIKVFGPQDITAKRIRRALDDGEGTIISRGYQYG